MPITHVRENENFPWTKRREKAAYLVAENKLTDIEIAAQVGVNHGTIDRWKKRPGFQVRVKEHVETWRAAFKGQGIADRQARVDAANDRHRRLQQVIEERAKDPLVQDVPGGKTGLIVPEPMLMKVYEAIDEDSGTLKAIPRMSEMAYKYSVDTGLLKEMRELEKQVAQDLGQWTEKIQLEFEKAKEETTRMLMEDGLTEAEAVALVEDYLRMKV